MLNSLVLNGITQSPFLEAVASTPHNNNRVYYLIMAMVVVFIVLVTIVVILDIKGKENNRRGKKPLLDRFFAASYRFLSEFPLSRGYVEKIGYRYRFISPCDGELIARRTVIACLTSWMICLIAFCIIFVMHQNVNTLVVGTIGVFVADSVVIGTMAKLFEVKILQEIEKLLSNVVHNYYVEYRADDALHRSLEFLSRDMKQAALQIYDLLLSDDKEVALREYYENVPNKYLRAFVGQCMSIMERGDEEIGGKHLFVRNLEALQREIDIEVEKLQRLHMEFTGVIIIVVAPMFCLDFIKQFAISIKETMDVFYYGKLGFLCDMGFVVFTIIIYMIMRKSAEFRTFHQSSFQFLHTIDRIPAVKKAMDNYCDKYASKLERLKRALRDSGDSISPRLFVLRSFLLAGLVFLIGLGVTNYIHLQQREQLLTANTSQMETLTSAAKENQYEEMGRVVEKYTKKYTAKSDKEDKEDKEDKKDKNDKNDKNDKEDKKGGTPDTQEKLTGVLEEDGTFYNSLMNEALAKEILSRVNSYKKEYFSFIDLCICIVIGLFTYYLPILFMKYNATVSKDAMEDEVNQFNATICMLRYIDGMSVKLILQEMESFAVVFKPSIRICINDYGSGDMEALNALKEREPYEPFERIVENLMRCDDMPIDQAFHEIDTERDGYISKRKLANEKSIKKRVQRAYLLAVLPLFLLIAYGVFPALISSMNEISAMMKELNSSTW